jgi:pantoate--beta-alanine ligase
MFAFSKSKHMLIFDNKLALKTHFKTILIKKASIGFVPTMGALHNGHLSLIQESLDNNQITVVSIFVNPTQFNNPEDLAKYPRSLDSDVEKIKTISNQIIVYAPTVSDIYEDETVSEQFDYDGLENQMEGKFRPGHFNGVGTIVKKLFEIVQPNNAYFGEKDFQQLQIVRKMVEKNSITVNIVCCAIFREPNGLAMSSRNERLSTEERDKAAIIFETLQKVYKMYKNGTIPVNKIKDWVDKKFKKNKDFELEYFEIADEETLISCKRKNKTKTFRAFIAIFINNIRLIDTISLK